MLSVFYGIETLTNNIMNAKSFLNYQYGITLLKEKALIHPEMLLKAMEEYAEYRVKNCNAPAVSKSVRLEGRELLLAFREYLDKIFYSKELISEKDIDDFLSQQ